MSLALIILGVIALIALYGVGIYNRLVTLRNQVKNAWSQIDVQLQRRYDLIPNLVETVKGYMNYEKGTLDAVVQARSQAMNARSQVANAGGPTGDGSIKELMAAENTLRGSLGNLFALAENYPQLKANETMQTLQEELSSTENKVAFSRQAYNDQAMLYNTAQEVFPTSLFVGIFGHHPVDLYQVEDPVARKSVKVDFS